MEYIIIRFIVLNRTEKEPQMHTDKRRWERNRKGSQGRGNRLTFSLFLSVRSVFICASAVYGLSLERLSSTLRATPVTRTCLSFEAWPLVISTARAGRSE